MVAADGVRRRSSRRRDRKSVVEGKRGDLGGTGVQTCALPISWRRRRYRVTRADGPERIADEWWQPTASGAGLREGEIGRASWRGRGEISVGLEFRRVLFRSPGGDAAIG